MAVLALVPWGKQQQIEWGNTLVVSKYWWLIL
jgi:hypothetical protein